MTRVTITLEDGQMPHVHVTDGVRERRYQMPLETLVERLHDDSASPLPWTTSPLLPPQTVFWAGRGSEQCWVGDLPAASYPWVLEGSRESAVIPLPRLLFFLKQRDTHIIQTAIVAVADDAPLQPDTPLYTYPLSNVYSNTTCCWTVPSRSYTPADWPGLVRIFFSTPNNWDLTHHTNRSGLDYRGLVAALSTRSVFPPEWLQPLGFTWSTWITSLLT